MRPDLEVDQAQIDAIAEALVSEVLLLQTLSIHSATRRLEQGFERITRAAVKGRASRAWASKTYPNRAVGAYEPVGEVFGKGGARTQGMLYHWTMPGTNRARHGEYLAVPLQAALGTSRGRHIGPREWEGRFGVKLRPLFRPGETPLLVADGAFGPGGFVRADRAGAKRRGGQAISKVQTIPVFALIPFQANADTVALEPEMAKAQGYLLDAAERAFARLGN